MLKGRQDCFFKLMDVNDNCKCMLSNVMTSPRQACFTSSTAMNHIVKESRILDDSHCLHHSLTDL